MATRVGTVDIITSLDDAHDLAPEWDDLAATWGRTPFALPGLALAWWRHLGRGDLLVVAVRGRSGELLAVAPLHVRRIAGLDVARWLGAGLGTVSELVIGPNAAPAAQAVWDALGDEVNLLDLVECRHHGFGLLELRRSPTWTSRLNVVDLCPVLDLGTVGSVEEVLGNRSNLRKKLARYDRAVAATGERFEVEAVTEVESLATVLPELEEVYTEAEQAQPRQHLLAPPWRDFMIDAMDSTARDGRLVVFVGRLGNQVVAFDIAIRIGDTLADWVGRYRPDLEALSVGHLLMREVVRWGIDNGIETLDLLLGDHEYKRRWSSSSYDTLHVVSGRGRWRRSGSLLLGGVHTLHPARAELRRRLARVRPGGGQGPEESSASG